MTLLFNKKQFTKRRQSLRRGAPSAEQILWQFLRKRHLGEHKFRRQYGIGKYIVDFYCPRKKLVIEVDGPTHFEKGAQEKDLQRQRYIESLGIKVVRVMNSDVYENIDGVIDHISFHLEYAPVRNQA